MRYRKMGRLGWEVSEIGYGMWGIGGGPGGFTGWDYDVAPDCPDLAVAQGCVPSGSCSPCSSHPDPFPRCARGRLPGPVD